MKKRLLITAIGSFSAKCVITTLKVDGYYIVGTDIYPGEWHAETRLCDKFYLAPLAIDEENYINFLINVSMDEDVKMILPLTDLEIDVINRHREKFVNNDIKLLMPEENVLQIVRDKYLLYEYFKNDVSVPSLPTFLYDRRKTDIAIPLVAKPRNGRSSEGLMKIYEEDQVSHIPPDNGYIVQPLVKGLVVTVDYVRCKKTGNDFCVPRRELLRTKNGAGTTVSIIQNKNLEKLVSHIGRRLDINGCINLEFIESDNQYWLIDINPRFSAGIAFTTLAGYNMVTSHIRCHNDLDILPGIEYKTGIMTKTYSEIILT